MGQKVHPYGFRLGITKDWLSRWFTSDKKKYVQWLHEDIRIRRYIKQKLSNAAVSRVEIERYPHRIKVIINTARPGMVIGQKGKNVEELRKDIVRMAEDINSEEGVVVEVKAINQPELDAQLVAENIARRIEGRVSFRRAMKQAVEAAMRRNAQGIKVSVSGRLGGAEIARTEWYRRGRVPLQTIRADIDYGFAVAITKYGTIGVKVWIFKGEISPEQELTINREV